MSIVVFKIYWPDFYFGYNKEIKQECVAEININ